MFSSLLFHKWLIDIVSIAHLPKKSDIFCESFPRNPQLRSRHPLLGRLRAHHAVYGTVCTNAAFLGNAITEGIFGAEGLMLTSIFLIPQRMAMWSVGVSYFMQGAGAAPTTPEEKRAHRKAVILKTIRRHCILAEKYNGDSAFASKCVAVSTALSLITTPLWCLVA